ncbi:hypothetical protein BJN41_08275 [Acinetobacter towneri]|uniref:Uncharacterized protein n=1 Tax=Acinetobacter towneri TaxID=202956 RepID=A0A1E8E4G3_9GAMM|nr:hypothetical protein BJN41_08275 [Acinetobacter towneri]
MLCTNIKVGLLYENLHLPARFSQAFYQNSNSLPTIYASLSAYTILGRINTISHCILWDKCKKMHAD